MKMTELVKWLVAPFLEEDTNLEYDGSVPATKPGDKLNGQKIIKKKKKKTYKISR